MQSALFPALVLAVLAFAVGSKNPRAAPVRQAEGLRGPDGPRAQHRQSPVAARARRDHRARAGRRYHRAGEEAPREEEEGSGRPARSRLRSRCSCSSRSPRSRRSTSPIRSSASRPSSSGSSRPRRRSSPEATWAEYGELFEEHSTELVRPALLAALVQVESAGNPLARTYWRWRWSWNPLELYAPASSAVGILQITDGTLVEASRLCIHDHVGRARGRLVRPAHLLVQRAVLPHRPGPLHRDDGGAPARGDRRGARRQERDRGRSGTASPRSSTCAVAGALPPSRSAGSALSPASGAGRTTSIATWTGWRRSRRRSSGFRAAPEVPRGLPSRAQPAGACRSRRTLAARLNRRRPAGTAPSRRPRSSAGPRRSCRRTRPGSARPSVSSTA